MAFLRLPVLALLLLAGCPDTSPGDTPDGGAGIDGGGDDGGTQPTPQCDPACGSEPNAEVTCTVFHTCESTCSTGYARCEDSCVAESPQQCGTGCTTCPSPSNGDATCSDGVCGVTCDPGFVPCSGYSGASCCPYASDVIAPAELGGYLPSIAIDDANRLHVAYYSDRTLRYVGETATGLVRETARWYWTSGGNARFQLALGAKGPLIVYTYPNSTSGLFLAERRSTGWAHTKLAPATPMGFSLATDRAGRAHVCYSTNEGLGYAIRRGDKWTFSWITQDAEARGACAIAVGADGLPHVAYYRVTAREVIYAKGNANGSFVSERVDSEGSVGSDLAIAVAPDGTPHIAAYRSDTEDLRWATLVNGAWSVQNVGTGRVGAAPRIAIQGDGTPVVSWFDYDYYRIVVAVKTGATWTEGVSDIGGGAGALAPAPDGSVWMATGDGEVLAHQLAGGAWSSYAIDLEHTAGTTVALLQRNAEPAAVYTQKGADNIERVAVATRSGGAWSHVELAEGGTAPSAALDGTGKLHLAYTSATYGINYAAEAGGGFSSEPVAAAGLSASIALGANNTPHVVYVGRPTTTTYALMLAVRGATGWTSTTIGAAGTSQTYLRPVVRIVNGVVHVQWYDAVAKAVIYASSTDGYTKVTVEANAEGGHDLYVSPAGVPHACVHRRTSSSWPDLRYATRATTTWTNVLVPAPGTRLNSGVCAIGADAAGTIGIARSMVYGAGLGELLLTTLGATTTHTTLQDDFYSRGLSVATGANGLEVISTGQPYNGTGSDQYRIRWAHR